MKNKRKRAACLLLALLCVAQLLTVFCLTAFAEGETLLTVFTPVLSDLEKDSSFDKTAYPGDPKNMSLDVITIAESTTRELLIYVYQPAGEVKQLLATSINISTAHDAVSFDNYPLTFLGQSGVFQKYVVRGLTVSEDASRYYEITNIYRCPISMDEISTGYDDGNIVNEISFPVGKSYKFTDVDDSQVVEVIDMEYITVTDKYVGLMRYPRDSFSWFNGNELDVHYVAFSTDKKIDQLLEADVYYQSQSVDERLLLWDSFGKIVSCKAELVFDGDKIRYDDDTWVSFEYEWNTIEKATDFLVSEDNGTMFKSQVFDSTAMFELDEEARRHIASKDWVLRFAYTTYDGYDSSWQGAVTIQRNYTIVSNVSILRLKFETDGKIYNLGVVDNKQTGSGDPDNEYSIWAGIEEWFQKIMAVILLIFLFVVFWPFLSPIIATFFKFVWNVFVKILLLPLKIVKRLLFPPKNKRAS